MLGLCQSLKLPLLVSFRGVDASHMLNDPRYVTSLRELFVYAHLVVMSHAMGERLIGLGANPERTHYLPTGIPLDDFPPAERRPLHEKTALGEPITFLQISRFKEKKGHQITLHAFKEFLPAYPQSTLILAGDGDTLPAAKTLAGELGLGDRVKFLGEIPPNQVPSLLAAADVFVHHSITASDGDQEGTPNAVLEAMATGLPVISSHHAGIPDVITDGQNGYLVEERNIPAYTNKMRAVLHDNGRIGRAAQNIRDTLDIRHQCQKLSQIYEDIIQQAANPDQPAQSRNA
jgi:glycosyltransferase involved in cell wall biosynthesis